MIRVIASLWLVCLAGCGEVVGVTVPPFPYALTYGEYGKDTDGELQVFMADARICEGETGRRIDDDLPNISSEPLRRCMNGRGYDRPETWVWRKYKASAVECAQAAGRSREYLLSANRIGLYFFKGQYRWISRSDTDSMERCILKAGYDDSAAWVRAHYLAHDAYFHQFAAVNRQPELFQSDQSACEKATGQGSDAGWASSKYSESVHAPESRRTPDAFRSCMLERGYELWQPRLGCPPGTDGCIQ